MADGLKLAWRGLLLASAATGAIAATPEAAAETCQFSLEAQPLRTGLAEYGRQTGIQVLASARDVRDQRGAAVRGEMDCRQGLDVLIAQADLAVVADDGQTVTLAAAAEPPPSEPESGEEIVVVGSQIRGARITDALPVTVIGRNEIDAGGASSGDALFRSIPQMGEVAFNESRTVGGVNDARGDVASINLRSLGTGNTLMLINGRRMVLHPGTQAENLVPVVTPNANSIPLMGVERIEVLRDGASAIYGTDAVAGVVNTVLDNRFNGFTVSLQSGEASDSGMQEQIVSFQAGFEPSERTHISLFGSFTDRDPLFARERDYAANADLTHLLDSDWVGVSAFNGTSTSTPWGTFDRVTTGTIAQGANVLTNSSGQFHIQPSTYAGCRAPLPGGICIDDGSAASAVDPQLRYNINDERTISGGVERANLFALFSHDINAGLEAFGEVGLYHADYESRREQAALLSATRITIPASNYWNPFGPTMFGLTPNPNRLPGLTNVPASGIDIQIVGYRPIDVGPRYVTVEDLSARVLAGLRGEFNGWDWESAALYSRASTNDTTHNRISNTLFYQSLALSTPDAYNIFNGGNTLDVANGDATPNSEATMDAFRISVSRESHTTLAQWDFRVSNASAFNLPAGGLGVAAGVEVRRETFGDNRDPRLDGTISYTDPITGLTGSDVMGSSPTNDTSGARTVEAAYIEFAVPIVSPDMHIPGIYSLDAQVAGRYENYTLFGGVAKPRVAVSWRPFESLQFRTTWSEGFRAPNLQQLYENGLERVNTRSDYIRCAAAAYDAISNPNGTFATCGSPYTQAVVSTRSGSRALEPEESENFTAGLTYDFLFIPPEWGRLIFTADYWRVEQEGIVGVFSDTNQIALDYLYRVTGMNGGFNPAVVRDTPTAQDITDFSGTPYDPVGQILYVDDNYRNLLPREVEGVDFSLTYDLPNTPAGDFSFRANAAQLLTFFQDPSEQAAELLQAQADGIISSGFTVEGANSLLRVEGRPEWRWTTSLTWRLGSWGAGWQSAYVGSVLYPGVVNTAGDVWKLDSSLIHSGYVQYTFSDDTPRPVQLRFGARNIFDEDPPLAPGDFGYNGELHSAQGRFVYASVRATF